jgi:CBS domain-containing protein
MDLARQQSANPVYLVGDIHKAASAEALAEVAGRVPGLQVQLVSAGASERQIGEVLATVNDAITTRLLELAEARLGAPPARYAWVAGGSQGRREQTAQTDQDNALVLDDALAPGDDDYFAALARFVNDGLDACGLAYCPGEVMARNPKWRQPAARWRRYFDTWIETPERMALMLSSVFFDLRVVRGEARLLDELQRENLAKSRRNAIFLAHMTGNALSERPPLGLFRRFVVERGGEHPGRFDVKRTGILPVVHLARIYALAEGCAAVNTVERLRETAATPTVSAEGARSLEDAYAYIGALRLRHQARRLRRGARPDNFVAPGELSRLERVHLKEAFRIVATMQQALERRYPARPPGG